MALGGFDGLGVVLLGNEECSLLTDLRGRVFLSVPQGLSCWKIRDVVLTDLRWCAFLSVSQRSLFYWKLRVFAFDGSQGVCVPVSSSRKHVPLGSYRYAHF